jgi:hypothetical protein
VRPDLPPELIRSLERLPPGLRKAAERAVDAHYPTVEEETEERRARERSKRIADAHAQRELADLAERALEGEWGDDVRRAVDEIVREVRAGVLVLADWSKRARRRDTLTRIEFAAARQAFESRPVRYALAAAKKIIDSAERQRRKGTP